MIEEWLGDELIVGHFEGVAQKPVVLIRDDNGHSFFGVVDLGHEFVGLGGDEGVGADGLLGCWVEPIVIEAGKGEEFVIG